MTKEELEDKFEDCFDANTYPTQGGFGPDSTNKSTLWRSFQPIALEYAKQQAIAFMRFCFEKEHISTDFEGTDNVYFEGNYFHDPNFPKDALDVYNKFIEQQNKG